MVKLFYQQCRIAILSVLLFSILTGLIYPCFITLLAQVFFPWKANGSLIMREQTIIGSLLLGQSFSDPKYFFPRPSSTGGFPYNALASSGSNYAMGNKTYLKIVQGRINALKAFMPKNNDLIPLDLVTASGSGLDPHISVQAALYQAGRIAKVRQLAQTDIEELIQKYIERRSLGILGEPRVNVLLLNLALDTLSSQGEHPNAN